MLIFSLFTTSVLKAQIGEIEASQKNSSEEYIKVVRNGQNAIYEDVIRAYDQEINQNRYSSLETNIEKCRFIEHVFFNEEEYYNPKQDDFDNCLEELREKHPTNPQVAIYYYLNQYEDSATVILEGLVDSLLLLDKDKIPSNIWEAQSNLAYHYSYQDNKEQLSIAYAKDAMSYNDTLDLSSIVAEQYYSSGELDKASSILIQYLDSTKTTNYYQKASLFSKLENYEMAYWLYKQLSESDEDWDLSSELGDVLVKLERFEEARPYLMKASENIWGARQNLEKLFLFDIKYSEADTALSTYNLMREQGFWSDPFGMHKIRLVVERGLVGFKFRDLLPIFSFTMLLIFSIALPYLWITPIYAFRKWRDEKGYKLSSYTLSGRWDLKHFWYLCSLFILVSFLAEIFTSYPSFLATMNDEYIAEGSIPGIELANSLLLFDLLMVLGIFFVVKVKDIKLFLGRKNDAVTNIMLGIGYMFILKFIYGISSYLMGDGDLSGGSASLLEDSIVAVIDNYGALVAFFSVVIIAPIIEEIEFRGIMLGSMNKYIPFWVANAIQSILFVLVHDDLSLFVFYFAFGMLTGYLRKKTGSFVAPVVLHMLNNLIAFFAILYM